jgi:hypothetical protein
MTHTIGSCYGCTSHYGFDAEGYERRMWAYTVVECPGCQTTLVLVAETESWEQRDDGRWNHAEYGPAEGVCEPCGLLFVDSWDGCLSYRLRGEAP